MAGIENKSSHNEDKKTCETQVNQFNNFFANSIPDKDWDIDGINFKEIVELSALQNKMNGLTEESKENIKNELSIMISRQLENGIFMFDNKTIAQVSNILLKYGFIKNIQDFKKRAAKFLNSHDSEGIQVYKKEDGKLYLSEINFVFWGGTEYTSLSASVMKNKSIDAEDYADRIKNNGLNLSCEK